MRGNPPNVVKLAPETLRALSNNSHNQDGFLEESLIHALGTHSKLVELFAQVSIIVKTEVRRDFGK